MVTTIRKVTGGDHPFYEFACLSTDTKLTSLVPENSICHEIDTGKHFYFSNGQWKELPPKGGSGGGGSYTLPTASADTKGGVKIGSGLTMTGEVLSATGGGGAEKFIVTLTESNDTWTADKTVSEIVAADAAGQIVVAKYPVEGMPIDIPLMTAGTFAYDIASFSATFVQDNTLTSLVIYANNDGAEDIWNIDVTNTEIPNAPLIVTLTAGQKAGQFVGDKTNKEVYDAFAAGQAVILSASVGPTAFKLAVQYATFDGTNYEFAFIDSDAVKNTVSGGANNYVTASLA